MTSKPLTLKPFCLTREPFLIRFKRIRSNKKLNRMKKPLFLSLFLSVGVAAFFAQSASAQITLFSDNFESYPTSSTTTGAGGYEVINGVSGSPWQIQGGCGGGTITITGGVDVNGFGGSHGLFADWNNGLASQYTYAQYTTYGSVNAPGAGTTLSQIQVSLDIYISGSEGSSSPVTVSFQNNSSSWNFTPTLANGGYTPVTFTLDQATENGSTAFDPTLSSSFQVFTGAGNGFGFDNNNVLEFDNVLIQTVPEPASFALMGLGLGGLALFRRRNA